MAKFLKCMLNCKVLMLGISGKKDVLIEQQ